MITNYRNSRKRNNGTAQADSQNHRTQRSITKLRYLSTRCFSFDLVEMSLKNESKKEASKRVKPKGCQTNRYRYKKRSISISATSSKKLVRLERQLRKRNDRLSDLKHSKKLYIEKFTGLDVRQDNKVRPVQSQRNHIEELMSVYKIDTESDKLAIKLLGHNICKRYLINETCSNDCRLAHDSGLRFYYINHFSHVLLQLQNQFDGENIERKGVIFKDNEDKNIFVSLFVYYYKNLMHLVSDYEGKIDEYEDSLSVKLPKDSINTTEDADKKQCTEDEINKMMAEALRNNSFLRQYKGLLVKFDKKHSVGLSNYTKFINVDAEDLKGQMIGPNIVRILNILIASNKQAREDKNKTSSTTFGVDADIKQRSHFTNKQNFFVCNDCGFSLSLKDNDQRLLKHFQGRTHITYVGLWKELARLNLIFKLLEIDPDNYLPIESSDHLPSTNQRYNKGFKRTRYNARTNNYPETAFDESDRYDYKVKAYNSRRFVDKRAEPSSSIIAKPNVVQHKETLCPLPSFTVEKAPSSDKEVVGNRRRRPQTPSIEY